MTILMHGLAAYNRHGTTAIGELIRRASTVESGAHISACDRPIGVLGLVISAQVTDMFTCDCWSYVKKDGTRVSGGINGEPIDIDFTDDIAVELAMKEHGTRHSYCELFVHTDAILNVWLSRDYTPRQMLQARVLARQYDVGIHIVDRSTRVHHLVGSAIPKDYGYWDYDETA